METEKYIKTIEAVYFDGVTNVEQIAQWCGGSVVEILDQNGQIRRDIYAIDVPVNGDQFVTAGKDFYIFNDQQFFFALPASEFLSMFSKSE